MHLPFENNLALMPFHDDFAFEKFLHSHCDFLVLNLVFFCAVHSFSPKKIIYLTEILAKLPKYFDVFSR